MTYEHSKQYRCTIVRGKSLTDMDNLLPAYAVILQEICPIDKKSFDSEFNKRLEKYLSSYTKKTLDNHRTEIAGKLFGMYYEDFSGIIHISERTIKLLEDQDQPAFFKDLCVKYQFPSGMSKMHIVHEQIEHGVSIRQLSFVVKVLEECSKSGSGLTKKEIGYYILNSEDVLKGDALPEEVIGQISIDRSNKIERNISIPNKKYSYNYQHINEQLNLLYLANLIIYKGQEVLLNTKEYKAIRLIIDGWNKPPLFDFYSFNMDDPEVRKKAEIDWGIHFGKIADVHSNELDTSVESLSSITLGAIVKSAGVDTIELGDEGEEYVYILEKNRVGKLFPRFVNKIKKFGKIKGLGYDIQSVWAEGENPDFVKYIEVKSTKRVTVPSLTFSDTLNLTRNEWAAAKQHGEHFFIYRVYFSKDEVKVFVISNPYQKSEEKKIFAVPLNYRVDFDNKCGIFYAE